MNIELIRLNLDRCAAIDGELQPEEAARQALIVAQLLIAEAAQLEAPLDFSTAQLPVYIDGLKTAGAAQRLLGSAAAKIEGQTVSDLVRNRILELSGQREATEAELARLQADNQDLLDQEESLKARQKSLEEMSTRVEALIELQDQELKRLEETNRQLQTKLDALQEAAKTARDRYDRLNAEIGENGRIIKCMPESSGIDSVDALLLQMKASWSGLDAEADRSAALITAVLDELDRYYTEAESDQRHETA